MRSADANMAAPAAPPPLTDFKLGLRRRQLLLGDQAPSPSKERRGTKRTKPTSTDELFADQLGVPTRPPSSASTDKMEAATSAEVGPRGTAANQNAPTRGPANDTRAAACCWGGPATEGGGGCRGFEILSERSMSGTTAADPWLTPDSSWKSPPSCSPAL